MPCPRQTTPHATSVTVTVTRRQLLIAAAALPLAARAMAAEQIPSASTTARQVLAWVLRSRDAQGLPFVIVDKPETTLHAFGATGAWLGSVPVLVGAARGDHTVPGIGSKPLRDIALHERTTPAGRFATEPGRNLQGENVVWVDYDSAVSLHRMRSVNAGEQRARRMASPNAAERRITYGCINAPADFYQRVITPLLGQGPGIAYVLPDTESPALFFPGL